MQRGLWFKLVFSVFYHLTQIVRCMFAAGICHYFIFFLHAFGACREQHILATSINGSLPAQLRTEVGAICLEFFVDSFGLRSWNPSLVTFICQYADITLAKVAWRVCSKKECLWEHSFAAHEACLRLVALPSSFLKLSHNAITAR